MSSVSINIFIVEELIYDICRYFQIQDDHRGITIYSDFVIGRFVIVYIS